jgi:hypothetical protein
MTLIERLEAAEAGSQLLDAEIAILVDAQGEPWEPSARTIINGSPHNTVADLAKYWPRLQRYTTSLDAAMTLVPAGADSAGECFRLEHWNSNGVHAPHIRASAWVAGAPRVQAATPALALCIAALRARGQS